MVARLDPESVDARRRKLVRMVCVKVIQEGEEWPLRLPAPGQPVEKLAIDHRRLFSIGLEEPPEVFHRRPQEIEIQPIFEEPSIDLEPSRGRSTRTAVLKAESRGKM